jgi:hypothetical protein
MDANIARINYPALGGNRVKKYKYNIKSTKELKNKNKTS